MANRLLFTRSYHLWGAFLVLAFVPGIANAVTYTTPDAEGVYKDAAGGRWYRHQASGELRWNPGLKSIETDARVNVGPKSVTLPARAPVNVPALGKQIAKASRFASPASIGLATLPYLLDHLDDLFDEPVVVCDGAFSKGCESTGGPDPELTGQYIWSWNGWNCTHSSNPCGGSPDAVCSQFGGNNVSGSGTSRTCRNGGSFKGYVNRKNNPCFAGGQQFVPTGGSCTDPEPPTYEVDPLTPEDWDVIEDVSDWLDPPEQVVKETAETTPGVPVEDPVIDQLPLEVPVTDPYQNPGTGQWEQTVSRIFPGPDDKVGVETRVVPLTGPEGVKDPTVEERTVTNTPPSETIVEVNICKDGQDILACMPPGTPEDPVIDGDEFELELDTSPIGFTSGECPAGPSFATPYGQHEFDMYWPCEFATTIKPIILALGAFAAVGIFVGGLRTS